MGSFFTNVQVRAGAESAEATRTAIVDALTARAATEGFGPCDEGAEPDRTIYVGPAEAWIAVYDEATESQNGEALDALAGALSGVTGGPAVGVLVHDSDELLLRLFVGGRLVDELVRGTRSAGSIEAWAKLCPGTEGALRAALGRRDLFKEQTLHDVAVALGMLPERACTGLDYLRREGPVPDGTIVLRLRLAKRPTHEQATSGPPRFTRAAFNPTMELSVGGPMHLGQSMRNEGGASRGLMVAVHGDAIEAGLVLPERVQIVVGMPRQGGIVVERPLESRRLENGKPGYVAELHDLLIPPGHAGGLEALAGVDPRKWVEFTHASQVHANVHGKAAAAGKGQLLVSFVPLQASEAQLHHAIALSVLPAPRRPLRGAARDPSAYVALEVPEVLVALAVSTLDRAQVAPIAAEIVERWSGSWPADAALSSAMFGAVEDRPTRPRTAKLKIAGLAKSAAWNKLRAAFLTDSRVSAMQVPDPSAMMRGEPVMRGDGFEFGGALAGPQRPADPELPVLQLSVDLRGRDDVADILERSRALVDEFVLRGRCVQAVMARWKGDGTGHCSVDSTPYERACGSPGMCALQRSWATRFLRAVSGDAVWLGPGLLARVDRAALDGVATCTSVGDALRIVLREGATLDALEAVLAPVLASEADYRAGVDWLYGRAERPPG